MKLMTVEKAARIAHGDTVKRLVKIGDILTHTRCMGGVEEHVYTGSDGPWLCGRPTTDTMLIEGPEGTSAENEVNDISPENVTHINRVPVENVDFLAPTARKFKYPS